MPSHFHSTCQSLALPVSRDPLRAARRGRTDRAASHLRSRRQAHEPGPELPRSAATSPISRCAMTGARQPSQLRERARRPAPGRNADAQLAGEELVEAESARDRRRDARHQLHNLLPAACLGRRSGKRQQPLDPLGQRQHPSMRLAGSSIDAAARSSPPDRRLLRRIRPPATRACRSPPSTIAQRAPGRRSA